jgi:hypothetical protein
MPTVAVWGATAFVAVGVTFAEGWGATAGLSTALAFVSRQRSRAKEAPKARLFDPLEERVTVASGENGIYGSLLAIPCRDKAGCLQSASNLRG